MIVLHEISKSYGEKNVLSRLSLQIPDGAAFGLMAPSGAGKTTLLRLILGLEMPDSGTVSGIPKRKAVLFQEDRLLPELSVLKNIQLCAHGVPESDIRRLLTELDIASCAEQKAGSLSGGQSRRAALARALLAPGQLLVLDEPFNGLDRENRLLAAQAIRHYRGSRTLLIVSHRSEEMALAGVDRVLTI